MTLNANQLTNTSNGSARASASAVTGSGRGRPLQSQEVQTAEPDVPTVSLLLASKGELLAVLQKNGLQLQYASAEMQADSDVVRAAVSNNGMALEFAAESVRLDMDIINVAVKKAGIHVLKFVPLVLLKHILSRRGGRLLQAVGSTKQANRDLVMVAVEQDGLALQYASTEMQADSDVVRVAVSTNGMALEFAAERLRQDMGIIKVAAKKSGMHVLKFVPITMLKRLLSRRGGRLLQWVGSTNQANKELVMVAVKQDGLALQYAAPALQRQDDIIECACRQNGAVLSYVYDQLGAEICKQQVQRNGYLFRFAPAEIKKDPVFVLSLLVPSRHTLCILKYITAELLSDAAVKNGVKKLMGTSMFTFSSAFHLWSRAIRDDKELVLAAVQYYGPEIKYASEGLRDDKEVVMAAVKENASALQHASARLQDDDEVVSLAVARDQFGMWAVLQYASDRLKADLTLVDRAMKKNKRNLRFAAHEIIQSKLAKEGCLLECCSNSDKNNKAIVDIAVAQTPLAWRFASQPLVHAAFSDPAHLQQQASDVLAGIMSVDGSLFLNLNTEQQQNPDIIFEAYKSYPALWGRLSEQAAIEVFKKACRSNFAVSANMMGFVQPIPPALKRRWQLALLCMYAWPGKTVRSGVSEFDDFRLSLAFHQAKSHIAKAKRSLLDGIRRGPLSGREISIDFGRWNDTHCCRISVKGCLKTTLLEFAATKVFKICAKSHLPLDVLSKIMEYVLPGRLMRIGACLVIDPQAEKRVEQLGLAQWQQKGGQQAAGPSRRPTKKYRRGQTLAPNLDAVFERTALLKLPDLDAGAASGVAP